jgi:hypothetical protein
MTGAGLDDDMKGDPSGSSSVYRFWMPKGTSRNVVFLTDGNKSPIIWEHNYQYRGNWRNWLTCLSGMGVRCPMCDFHEKEGKYGRYKIQLFTVIDCNKFTDKKGVVRENEKRVVCAKKDSCEVIARRWKTLMENGNTLRYAMFKVHRGNSDKSAGVGDDYEFIKMVDPATIADPAPMDYKELFAPQPEKMARVVEILSSKVAAGEDAPEGTDTSVAY